LSEEESAGEHERAVSPFRWVCVTLFHLGIIWAFEAATQGQLSGNVVMYPFERGPGPSTSVGLTKTIVVTKSACNLFFQIFLRFENGFQFFKK
jgi:hypothetical protein